MGNTRGGEITDGFVPTFLLTEQTGTSEPLPLVVSIITLNESGEAQPLPAVQRAIDRTVEATGKEGLIQARIIDRDRVEELVPFYVKKGWEHKDAILLLQCLNAELAEEVMQCIGRRYRLALITHS